MPHLARADFIEANFPKLASSFSGNKKPKGDESI